jgi:hypothetical protein
MDSVNDGEENSKTASTAGTKSMHEMHITIYCRCNRSVDKILH